MRSKSDITQKWKDETIKQARALIIKKFIIGFEKWENENAKTLRYSTSFDGIGF